MLRTLVDYHEEALKLLRAGTPLSKIRGMQVIAKILRTKFAVKNDRLEQLDAIREEMMNEFATLGKAQEVTVSG
jgi:hypothetical protein